MITQPIFHLLIRLWNHISPRRHVQFGLLLILMLFASFSEMLSIGAMLPFLGVLTAPEKIFNFAAAQPIIQALNLNEPTQLLLPLTIAFCLATLIAGVMRILLLWATNRLSFAVGADLSIGIYRRTLYQSYALHCARNTSEVISGISSKSNVVIYNIILPTLTLISSSLILIAILILLLSINPLVAISAFGGFGVIYAVIIKMTRKQLIANSHTIASESVQVTKSLQEGLGGIRDILIDGNQEAYCQIYSNADLPLRRAQGNSLFIGSSPRYGVEALGMILIATLAYWLANNGEGIGKAIPVIGAIALGAQRLLPLLQQGYNSWSQIISGQASLQDALNLLDQPLPDRDDQLTCQSLKFKKNIILKQIDFQYSVESSYVIKDLNLTIKKGSRTGFIGITGSGKSTLLDIIMGLLQPTDGSLIIDGQLISLGNCRAWQAHIAHVPQAIFLADNSIAENIAFGVPKDKIDFERVRKAAKQAQIADSIASWPKQYETFVGERGVRLSGGQRQRIGIARALYKEADVIIFDEATSALDNETEQAVMHAIEGLSQDLTVLIIAHRLTTLKKCTQIVELGEGGIKRVGTYNDIVNLNSTKKL
jgi:ABC-type multidrug transport system fused ATPase/permease subunit